MTKEELAEAREDARIAKILGYRGAGNKVYHSTCLCDDDAIWYDKTKEVTKQIAWKENLICDICGQPICPPKYSKFLKRVTDAKSHRTT